MSGTPALDRVLVVALAGYVVFGLACTFGSDDDNNTSPNNTTSNNTQSSFEGGPVKEDLTLEGEVTINRSVTVQEGATITIKPGTTIKMCSDCYFAVGAFGSNATIMAEGTADKPIKFVGQTADQGFWHHLSFEDNVTSNSKLAFVSVEHAGGNNHAVHVESNITISNLKVIGSKKVGLRLDAPLKEESTNITVEGSGEHPVVINDAQALTTLPVDGDYSKENGKNTILVEPSKFDGELNVPNPGIPYFLDQGLYLQGEGSMTVEPGVRFIVNSDKSVNLGAFGTAPAFTIKGTAEAPIIFEGFDPAEGAWKGITVEQNVRLSASVMEHVQIMHGGDTGKGCLNLEAALVLKNVHMEKCKGFGLTANAEGFGEASEALTITGVKGKPARIAAEALVSLPTTGSTFTGNDDDRITVNSSKLATSGTIPDPGVPFFAEDGILIQDDDTAVTFSPGISVQFGTNKRLIIGAFGTSSMATIEGTAEKPIVFTSNDTTPGVWDGVVVERNARTSTSLKYVHINYGGTASKAGLTLQNSATVESCTFENSAGYGLHIDYSTPDGKDYSNNTFTNNAKGDVLDDRMP